MVRILGTKGSRRRHRNQFAAILSLVALLGLFVAQPALAVHDEQFQLDGDVSASTPTNIGGNPQPFDWDSFFNSTGGQVPGSLCSPQPCTGFTASGFDKDFTTKVKNGVTVFDTSDATTFTQGSKDINNISSNWVCTTANNVTDKGDILNAYAVAFTDPGTGDQKLYFALERSTNTGDANVAFWFLQQNANCPTGGGAWTGDHQDGDILIVSAFTKGGSVSTITAYRWNGGAGGSLGTTPAGTGGDCRDTTLGTGDKICATANMVPLTGAATGTPWPTFNKDDGLDNSLQTSEFYEGGINLTKTSLAGKCFNVFVGDTRSSQQTTATLYDFARGALGECTSKTVTTPQTGAGDSIPSGGLSIGASARVEVRDHADITTTGISGSFDGTVKFFMCGPLALNSTSNCATGGVQIGTPLTGETVSGSGGSANVNSDTATLTSAGRYCWRAEYSGDSGVGVPPSSDPKSPTDTSTGECFKVNPLTPTLTTTAGADVILGNPITDTASLTGTAKQPGTDGIGPGGTINATAATQANAGGTITFSVKGPNSCNDSGLTVTGSPVTVSGDNPSYGPVSATPTAVGTYTFVATYSGNSPNTDSAGPSSCPNGDEEVVVTGNATSASKQRWLPNDRVVITGDTNLNGTLTVTFFSGDNCGVTSGSAIGGQQYTKTFTNATSPQVFNTTNTDPATAPNTTFYVGTNPDGTAGGGAQAYSWLVHYDDQNLNDPADKCETSTVSPITDKP